jgi:hypothetical protein
MTLRQKVATSSVALALAALLAGWVAMRSPSGTRSISTQITLGSLRAGCVLFLAEYGALPGATTNRDLMHILKGSNPKRIDFVDLDPGALNRRGEAVDAWGVPFRVNLSSPTNFVIESAGPDSRFGTPDDIR